MKGKVTETIGIFKSGKYGFGIDRVKDNDIPHSYRFKYSTDRMNVVNDAINTICSGTDVHISISLESGWTSFVHMWARK